MTEPLIQGTRVDTLEPLSPLSTVSTATTPTTTLPKPKTTLSVLGPLPTTFTPFSDCFAPNVQYTISSDNGGGWNGGYGGSCVAVAAATTSDTTLASTCYPTGLAGRDVADSWSSMIPAYSAAKSCPTSFIEACSVSRLNNLQPTGLNQADAAIWSALPVGRLILGCCPSGFACHQSVPYSCTATRTTGSVTPQPYSAYSSLPLCHTGSTALSLSAAQALQTQAARINLVYRNAGDDASVAGAPGGSVVESGEPGVSPELLGQGAKIAIGVCVPVVVIAIGIFAFLFWRKRREKKKDGDTPDSDDAFPAKAELESKNVKAPIPMQEMDATRDPQELPHNEKIVPVEAPVRVVAELPADEVDHGGTHARELDPKEIAEIDRSTGSRFMEVVIIKVYAFQEIPGDRSSF